MIYIGNSPYSLTLLKVKSSKPTVFCIVQDNRTSLLQFVVTRYVILYEGETMGTDRAKLPLPDPSDISQASLVNFDDIEKELKKIKKDFQSRLSQCLFNVWILR